MIHKQTKSVQSLHPCKSVFQTNYDIVKAHGGELKVKTIAARESENKNSGTHFIITLPY